MIDQHRHAEDVAVEFGSRSHVAEIQLLEVGKGTDGDF